MAFSEEEHQAILQKKAIDLEKLESEKNKEKETEKVTSLFSEVSSAKKILFFVMFCGNVLVFSAYSLLSPFFPHEAAKKDTSPTVVGLIIACYEFLIFLTSPIYGRYIVVIGFRFMYLSGVFVCGLCTILFGLLDFCPAGPVFIAMCFLTRILEALAATAFVIACITVTTISFPQHVALAAGSMESAMSLGALIGPVIGGLLYQVGGYFLPFVTVGTAIALCGAISCAFLPKQKKIEAKKSESLANLFRSKLVCIACYVMVCMGISISFFTPTLAEHLQPFGLSPALIGLVFTCCPLFYLILGPINGWFADKGFHEPMIVVGCFLSCLGTQLLGPSPIFGMKPTLWIIILGLAIIGTSLSFCQSASLKCLIEGALEIGIGSDSNLYGLMSGVYTSSLAIGMFTGPLIGGLAVEHLGFQMATVVCSLPVVIAGILMIMFIISRSSCSCSCNMDTVKKNDEMTSLVTRTKK